MNTNINNFSYATMRHSKRTSGFNVFTFKTPEQYREFRSDWKKNYKEITAVIRELKIKRKDPDSSIRSTAQSEKATMRLSAEWEMGHLEEAKTEYRRIRLEKKEEETVSA